MIRRSRMSCQELVELVTDYLEGALPKHDRARLDGHLRGCDGCTEYLAQMRRTIQVSGRLRPDALDPEARDRLLEVFRRWKAG
ncbi:MAG: anti-sigma factor family protein [Acidimicrobiales bacterium]